MLPANAVLAPVNSVVEGSSERCVSKWMGEKRSHNPDQNILFHVSSCRGFRNREVCRSAVLCFDFTFKLTSIVFYSVCGIFNAHPKLQMRSAGQLSSIISGTTVPLGKVFQGLYQVKMKEWCFVSKSGWWGTYRCWCSLPVPSALVPLGGKGHRFGSCSCSILGK